MQLGRLVLLTALALPAAALAQGAPFCVFSGAGAQCYYYNIQACQNAARAVQGMCAPNQARSSPRYTDSAQPAAVRPLQYCDGLVIGNICTKSPGQSFQEGYERGRRQKMEREEHEARMALLRAQTEAASVAPRAEVRVPVFRCHANGEPYLSDRDAGGCVYLGLTTTP